MSVEPQAVRQEVLRQQVSRQPVFRDEIFRDEASQLIPSPVPARLRHAGAGAGQIRAVVREVTAGATVAFIALPFCVSAGVLAYEPLGRDYIAIGAAAGILCAVSGGITGALARSSSFIPNVPSAPMALIQASFVSSLLASFGGDVALALAVMPLSVILAGIWQALFAWSGLVRAVKFTPYPVLAGFVTGLAILTVAQQFPRFFDLPSMGRLLAAFAQGPIPPLLPALFGTAIVALIRLSERVAPRIPAMLVGLVGGTAAWHALAALSPDLALGRTIGAVSLGQASVGLGIGPDTLLAVLRDGHVLQALLLTSLTLAVLGTLDVTFAQRAAHNLSDIPEAPRRNLVGQGLSNIASALTGGLAVTSSIGFSTTNFESGGRTRLSTVTVALVLLAAALAMPSLVSALPIVVLAAILISIAWKMWDRWCLSLLRDAVRPERSETRTRARRNGAIVAAVAAATVLGQPVGGALVGVLLACLVFILEMSRPIVRRRLDGRQAFSKRIRSQHDRAVLAARGGATAILDLQGVLFFGNADDLASEIKAQEGGAGTVILDLRRVTDLDTSGATILRQIALRCSERGVRLMIADVGETYRELLQEAVAGLPGIALFVDLDVALEAAEDGILARHGTKAGSVALHVHETDLAGGLSEAELDALRQRLEPVRYRAGEALCRTGEPADRLWLLTRGSVSVRIAGAHHVRRVAGLGPGTSVGEMGLLDRRPRSADVMADEDVEAYVLLADDFDALMRDEPHLGQSLLVTIARQTAQRLRVTSDELRLAEM